MRISASPWRTVLHGVLLSTVLLYTLLPYLGHAWHDIVPEHDHWFLGAAQVEHEAPFDSVAGQAEADATGSCVVVHPAEVVIHAFNPVLALSLLATALGLQAALCLTVPDGFTRRVVIPVPSLKSAPAFPLDPPPRVNEKARGQTQLMAMLDCCRKRMRALSSHSNTGTSL